MLEYQKFIDRLVLGFDSSEPIGVYNTKPEGCMSNKDTISKLIDVGLNQQETIAELNRIIKARDTVIQYREDKIKELEIILSNIKFEIRNI